MGEGASFPVDALRSFLDGATAAPRDAARKFLDAHPPLIEASRAEQRDHARAALGDLARAGFGDWAFPGVTTEAPDARTFIAAFQTLAFGDLSTLIKGGVQWGLFGGSIAALGSEAHRQQYLPRIARAELVGCFAMSESGHGSNVMGLETMATYDPTSRSFDIHTPRLAARKDWIGGAAHDAALATVFAELDIGGERRGVHAFLVPLRDEKHALRPGVSIADCGPKMGLNGVDNGQITFDHVKVPRDALLSRFAQVTEAGHYESAIESPSRRFFTMLGTLVQGRLSIAGGAVSVAKVALAHAIRYGDVRRQFGPEGRETRLLDYRTHRQRLLPALATTYALDAAMGDLLGAYVTRDEHDTRQLEGRIAGLKAIASWHAIGAVQAARECCGGQGYLAVNRLPALRADVDVFATFEGDNTVLMQLLAKALLTGHAKAFHDAGVGDFVRHLRDRLAARNPVLARRDDGEHLRSRAFQLDAFVYRETTLLESAGRRLARRIDDGAPPEQAQNEIQDHLLAVARAHVERIVFEAFSAAETRAEDERIAPVLGRLVDLYALARFEDTFGWYLEHGVFGVPKVKGIRKEIEHLEAELRPDAVALTEAWGIPARCLGPIAFGDPAFLNTQT